MNKQEIEKAIGIIKAGTIEGDEIFTVALDTVLNFAEHQLTNGWIPVDSALPEDNKLVLLSVLVDELEQVVGRWNASKNEWEIGNDVISWDWQSDSMVEEVIAWQPLPEPYKEPSHE